MRKRYKPSSPMILGRISACWLFWLAAAGVCAEPHHAPIPFDARYQLTRDSISIGETHLSLQLTANGGYLYRTQTEPNALLALFREEVLLEESRGQIIQQRFKPLSYLYLRSGSDSERRLHMEFDWQRRRVSMRGSSSRWSTRIEPGTLDKLLQQLVFSQDLAQGVRNRQYTVADGGRLKQYQYQVKGTESVQVPLGTFEALKVSRSKDGQASDYTLWLAPRLDYLPLRIIRRHAGASYRMELIELERSDGVNPSLAPE